MKLAKRNKVAKSFMTVSLLAAALGYASRGYSQESSITDDTSATTPAYENVGTGYKIGGDIVLTTPGSATDANTAVGHLAFTSDTTGTGNTAVGSSALTSDTTGSANTAAGYEALHWDTAGWNNTAFGWQALVNDHSSHKNTAVGLEALHNTDIDDAGLGNNNTAIGWQAGFYNEDGSYNSAIGYQACLNVVDGSNVTCIGASSGPAADVVGPATYIANVYGDPTTGTGNPLVCISSDGLLGTTGCASSGDLQQKAISQQEQKIQAQGEQITELQQRLARLEALIGKAQN